MGTEVLTKVEDGHFELSTGILEHHSVTSPPNHQKEVCTQWKIIKTLIALVSQVALVAKNPPANAGNIRDVGPWVRKIPWRRKRQPTPAFLSGKSLWMEEPGGLHC